MFERFTGQARQVVVSAQEESRRRGHNVIAVGHVVLGAIRARAGFGLAANTVDTLRRTAEATFSELVVHHDDPAGHIPFTSTAKTALERSLQLALQDRRNYINSRDILLAAVEQPELCGPLSATTITLHDLRTALAANRATAPEDDPEQDEPVRVTWKPTDSSSTIVELYSMAPASVMDPDFDYATHPHGFCITIPRADFAGPAADGPGSMASCSCGGCGGRHRGGSSEHERTRPPPDSPRQKLRTPPPGLQAHHPSPINAQQLNPCPPDHHAHHNHKIDEWQPDSRPESGDELAGKNWGKSEHCYVTASILQNDRTITGDIGKWFP